MSAKSNGSIYQNPGFFVAVALFLVYLVCWALLLGIFRGAAFAGLPLITWSMIILGVAGVCLSVIFIYTIDKWEKN